MKGKTEGHWYQTEKAEKIAEYDNGRPRNDLDYIKEALYRAPDGTLFFAGESGPRMRYARNDETGGKIGGEGITVTTHDDAAEWIELTQGENAANANLLLDGFTII